MVYSFYDPAQAARSLGTYMILDQVEFARRLGLPFVYLGYWIEGSRKMRYKNRFQPQEHLTSKGWVRTEDPHAHVRTLQSEACADRRIFGLTSSLQNFGPKLFDLGKPLGGKRPACARTPHQSLSSVNVKVRPAESVQVRPSFFLKTLASARPPCL